MLSGEIEAAFDMSCIEPVEALLVLDPSMIPKKNDPELVNFGNESLEVAHNFYGQCAEDTYQGKSTFSPSLLSSTNSAALKLEYGGYKTYISNRKEKVKSQLENTITRLKAKLLCAKANKTITKKDLQEIEKELTDLQAKLDCPITALELLSDSVIESAFPNIRYLLRLLVLVPHSEAVVERGFSKNEIDHDQ